MDSVPSQRSGEGICSGEAVISVLRMSLGYWSMAETDEEMEELV